MYSLLAASKIAIYVIAGIVGVIVFSVILHFINREFRIRYRLNLIGGGLLMLIAIGAAVGGVLIVTKAGSKIGYALFALTAICVLITIIYDFKKCGGVGFLALICQILFCVPALILILELFTNTHGAIRDYERDERDIRRARRYRGYDDNGYNGYNDYNDRNRRY